MDVASDPALPVLASARSSATNNPLSKKMEKILAVALDDADVQSALQALADMYPSENTLDARRNLRSDVEKRELAINRRFLDALDSVDQVRFF